MIRRSGHSSPGRHLTVRGREGMTLIEILLAIAVLVIGIVGLLPVFYAGLSRTKGTVQDTTAALVVQSVIEGVRNSMRQDSYSATERAASPPDNLVEYWHAGVKTGVFFKLPHTGDMRGTGPFEIEIPTSAVDSAGAAHPFAGPVFRLTGTEAGANELAITDNSKDQIGTYEFNFKIRPTSEPHIDNVYEVVVRVYRNYDDDDDAEKRESLIQEVHFIVAGN